MSAASQGSVTKTFKIVARNISYADITASNKVYTGSPVVSGVTATYNDKTLKNGTDYTVKYADNVNVGNAATVVVTGKGNFTDTASRLFTIKSADKEAQTFALGFSTDRTVTYGDDDFSVATTLLTGDGAITYQSSDTSVATVSADKGLVTIKKAGSTVMAAATTLTTLTAILPEITGSSE